MYRGLFGHREDNEHLEKCDQDIAVHLEKLGQSFNTSVSHLPKGSTSQRDWGTSLKGRKSGSEFRVYHLLLLPAKAASHLCHGLRVWLSPGLWGRLGEAMCVEC
jgi:hypothetical protein